jgi:hypothetical protein
MPVSEKPPFTVIDVSGLSPQDVALLTADVCDVRDEIYFGAPFMDDDAFADAERILLTRIGGQEVLACYVACLRKGAK